MRRFAAPLVVGVLAAGAWTLDQREGSTPTVQWAGPHSSIEAPQFHRITDQRAFNELWAAHRGERLEKNLRDWPVAPVIDFEQSMVIAYFRGPSRVNDGEFVHELIRRGEDLTIRFDALTFQTMAIDDSPIPDYSCTPYGIWVVDRCEGTVIIEEDKRRIIRNPPEWVEVHRFKPLG